MRLVCEKLDYLRRWLTERAFQDSLAVGQAKKTCKDAIAVIAGDERVHRFTILAPGCLSAASVPVCISSRRALSFIRPYHYPGDEAVIKLR